MDTTQLQNFAKLLEIRRTAARRNATISGTVLLLGLAAFFMLGMLGELTGLGLFVTAAVLIAFAFAFIFAWIRLETLAGLTELTSQLIPKGQMG